MESTGKSEVASTALALMGLDLQLRRHHYHSLEEDTNQLDLIELGAITNLEWDEKDGLWAQLDERVTFDITPTGSSICIYLDEEPVATLWAIPGSAGPTWEADWDADLTSSERARFLRKVRRLSEQSLRRVQDGVEQLRKESTDLAELSDLTGLVREWLGSI